MKTNLPVGRKALIIAVVLQLLFIVSIDAQQVNVKLGSENVTMKVVKDNRAIILPSEDASVIQKLNAKGIKSLPRMPSANFYSQGDVVLMEVKRNQSKDFNETVKKHNLEAVKDVSVSTVLKYDDMFIVLTDRFTVGFRKGFSINDVEKYLADKDLAMIRRDTLAENQFHVKLKKGDPLDALKNLDSFKTPDVIFFEPDYVQINQNHPSVKVRKTKITRASNSFEGPADPLFGRQWYLNNTGANGTVRGADIKALDAWQVTHGSNSIIIAILDEGVDIQHPDLRNKIYRPYDAVDGDNDQQPDEGADHGTACAGLASAETANNEGMSGIGYSARIMPVRIADSQGGVWTTSPDIMALGIKTAADRGAKVISCSWTAVPHTKIEQAIDYALSKNCIVIFAAGNKNGAVQYPARLSASKKIIAVGATNEWDESKRPGSKDGEYWGSNRGKEITLVAPGVHMCTTTISTPGETSIESKYIFDFNGTSSATPLVAGGIALMLSVNPQLTPTQVIDIISKNSDDLGPKDFDNDFGYGRLNVMKLIEAARRTITP